VTGVSRVDPLDELRGAMLGPTASRSRGVIRMTDRQARAAAPSAGVLPASGVLAASEVLAARSVLDLWDDYAAERSEEARNALVVHYLPLVRRVADRMLGGLPASVDVQDLYAEGHVGLIEAIERFEASRDVKFETFAQWRIKGSIQDYLRRQDWLSRSVRDQLKTVERAVVSLEHSLGRTPSDEEIAGFLSSSSSAAPVASGSSRSSGDWSAALVRETLAHYTTSHIGSLDDLVPSGSSSGSGAGSGSGSGDVADRTETPAEETHARMQLSEARSAVAELAVRERQLVALYFYEELTLADIGRILGVTESRVSQILKKVLIALAGKLEAA
jgi:RNA polymerase sigma factor for flagellar operon FliA